MTTLTHEALAELRRLVEEAPGVLTVEPVSGHGAKIRARAGGTVETVANVYCDGANGHAPDYAALFVKASTNLPALLALAEWALRARPVLEEVAAAYQGVGDFEGTGENMIGVAPKVWALLGDAPDEGTAQAPNL